MTNNTILMLALRWVVLWLQVINKIGECRARHGLSC